ncbi:MAG: long-chain fatty acid--CoA ligase, partial [Betaproteobacteria bacterium]|nr:long-chain fatty acid--CoA ligase [Betaproteobacteria bacterium]
EASALAFRDGWYLPGDLGYVDVDGFVYITGREKDMIIRGGVNVYPNEIESVLLGHEQVAEAAVVGAPSAQLGEEVIAYVTTRSPIEAEVLRALCAKELAPYKVPKTIVVLPEMPRTNVGKIDKQRLRNSLP